MLIIFVFLTCFFFYFRSSLLQPGIQKDYVFFSIRFCVLKTLGFGFRTRNTGSTAGSGLGAPREVAAESAAPVDPTPIVDNVDNTGNSDIVSKVADVNGPERVPKQRKLVGTKLSKIKDPVIKK